MQFLFKRNKKASEPLRFPCLAPQVVPAVIPLPSVRYRICIPKDKAVTIIKGLQEVVDVSSYELLKGTDLLRDSKKNKRTPNREIGSSFQYMDKMLKVENRPQIYICLLPTVGLNYTRGCLSALEEILMEGELVTFCLKGVRRAVIGDPEINLQNRLWVSNLQVLDDAQYLSQLDSGSCKKLVKQVQSNFANITSAFDSFRATYRSAVRLQSGSSERLFLLSPLSNTLFLLLSKAGFSKSWKLLSELYQNLEQHKLGNQKEAIFSLIDMTVAVLPATSNQRLRCLELEDPWERAKEFDVIIQELTTLLSNLRDGFDFFVAKIQDFTQEDKAAFIALQLSALRGFIEKPKQGPRLTEGTKLGSLSGVRAAADRAEKEKDEEDEDLKTISSFIGSLSVNEVHADGLRMLQKDLRRLGKLMPQSSEYHILRGYFDTIMDIPFMAKDLTKHEIDLEECKRKLDNDHYGLLGVKKRLIEYLSVMKLNNEFKNKGAKAKPPILLLVGPPGVGKTSIAKSIAGVLDRRFHRISLGGIHNEAEIRGHRRTYVGSMCGLIVNALRKSGSMTPLILLDEIDKVLSVQGGGNRGAGLNGDPGAALLEVLDPEQNSTFTDHYVGFPVDLSNVLFFCTANDLTGISAPLLNRMEVIEIPGYTPEEKLNIGSKFLLPKQIRLNGLDTAGIKVEMTKEAWEKLVFEYTREPGVRGLERKIASIARGKVVEYVQSHESGQYSIVTSQELVKYIGFPSHPISRELVKNIKFADKCGVVNGLAYGSDGTGNVLVFEMVKMGKLQDTVSGPRIKTTGNLGKVLNESIEIATTLVKSLDQREVIHGLHSRTFKEFLNSEWHLHVPMGAVSKDGPSAGAAIALALISAALNKPVSPKLCLTGEITLRGKILPIGGVKEKLLGAKLFGMEKVLLPFSNRQDVIEAIMKPEEYELCFASPNMPELHIVQQKWHLEVFYVDDFYDVMVKCWPREIRLTDTRVVMTTPDNSNRALL
ncbi:LAQU0S08e03378g1_1 [Lachancea quebecensis]|uniref:endopeptidase La n=1 Tax=Lachancea quebecensis TaxID=1654605 RepID=A0A0P1L1N4_9SACH|nr:LAQU0S08e03378g1_1 [Lachancea quebecensis]